jgi:hypothetical protein
MRIERFCVDEMLQIFEQEYENDNNGDFKVLT